MLRIAKIYIHVCQSSFRQYISKTEKHFCCRLQMYSQKLEQARTKEFELNMKNNKKYDLFTKFYQ